jgi:serine/threonine protein kinase/tetratricopeptide (TPR) repeat protein
MAGLSGPTTAADVRLAGMDLREQLELTLGDAYSLERELGGGGMSRVFVATEKALGRRVVVKVLPEEMAGQVSLERFKREIALAARLQHPHIVPLLTAGDANGLPYFTMPLVEGESLRARLRHGELPLNEAVRLLREIASALSYAHERNIVHRDIKPDNVLLSGGSAMITDFGVAKAISASSNSEGGSNTSMGVALGTPAYMSPEQASADPAVDHRADIYAFGVLAYELLTGQPPFAGRTPQGLLAAHVTEAPEVITRRRNTIPPALGALIMRCLEKRAADRPQTAMDLVHGLDQISTPSGGSPPTSALPAAPTGARTEPTSRRWIAVATALVVLIGAALFFTTRSAGASAARSIAVLPTDMGTDTAHAYLADGLSSELTTRLSKIPGLIVRAYSSSKTMRGRPLGEAGKALQVSSVLSASLMRSGTRLRVTASLVNVSDETVQWSETFEANDQDQFALQDKLVSAIASALKLSLSPATKAAVVARGTTSSEAHDLVQRAQFQTDEFTVASLRSAVSLAELAIKKDSNYAEAWATLAGAWGTMADDFVSPREALPHIRPAVQRALELDPQSAEAHAQLATLKFFYDWDLVAAKREFETALTLDSANTTASEWLPTVLDLDPALADSANRIRERGLRLNPGSAAMMVFATSVRALRALSPQARRERCTALLRLGVNGPFCEANLALVGGDTARALTLIRAYQAAHADALAKESGRATSQRARWLASLGDTAAARKLLQLAIEKSAHEYVREDNIATAFFLLGDIDRSVDWWRRSVESNGAQVIYLAKDRDFASLRADPRIQALLVKAGIR